MHKYIYTQIYMSTHTHIYMSTFFRVLLQGTVQNSTLHSCAFFNKFPPTNAFLEPKWCSLTVILT